MKRTLLLLGIVLNLNAYAQVTLFQDNFESGTANWTLNSGGSGLNQWIVNNTYLDNSGFDIVPPTPDQPMGTTNGPQSYYLHIHNTQACSGLDICNASFDTGSSSNRNATMTNSISTTGFTNVTLSFIYLCDGAVGSAYGVVEYSTDGGTSWTTAAGQYNGISTWTNASISLPAFYNQANLKFRFRWQNGNSGNDPAFAVDEIEITGEQGNFASVTTGSIGNNSFCTNASANISVPFTVSGTVNSGNQYIAQLSNNTGSFASPTTIGSLTSNSTGSLSINATIPSGQTAGTGYLIRVIATDPATTGTNSSTSLSINSAPTVSILSLPSQPTICEGEAITMQANGGVAYSWSPSGSLDNATAQTVSGTPTVTTVYTVMVTGQNGCSASSSITVTVDDCASISEEENTSFVLYPNPANEVISLSSDTNETPIQVSFIDVNGRTVLVSKTSENISIESLAKGTYQVQILLKESTIYLPLVIE